VSGTVWSFEDAERYVLSLELFGMRFGLDRMRRLMTALDRPQDRFRSIHVVGTNGKSSTVRMIAAILSEHGLRVGAYLSPHLVSFAERIRVGDADIEPRGFAAAIQRTARAAQLVDRTGAEDDHVTQFEALTAAAYSELAVQDVEVAVVEAGLGGRYDATNVLASSVQVLTNVGLDHTRWLGPTPADIAAEKLAVVRAGQTLVVGALDPDIEVQARDLAKERNARLVVAPLQPPEPVRAPGAFQRRNFAVARTAAEAYLGKLDLDAVRRAADSVSVPGRLQVVDRAPLTLLDGAHNAAGMAALVESLPELGDEDGPLVAVVSILDDKDATAILGELMPRCAGVVLTRATNPRALSPATLESLVKRVGAPQEIAVEADPRRALARARELAGPGGRVLATGSNYLVGDLLAPPGGRALSML
jgi:dihydrofolate synthase/folylpolyglutamate synthase